MSRLRAPTNREYIVGGLLGNVPLLLLIFILSFFEQPFLLGVQLAVLASLVGGAALAAYLVSVSVQSSHIGQVLEVGLLTGAFCFAMNLFLGFFLPIVIVNDYLKMLTFMIGGAMGSVLRTMKKRPVRSPSPT